MVISFLAVMDPVCQAASLQTTQRMCADAIRLLPDTLQGLTIIYWEDMNTALEQLSGSGISSDDHIYWHAKDDTGHAPRLISQRSCQAVKLIQKRESFARVFQQFGIIAFQVSESFNPLNTDDSAPQERYYYRVYEQLVDDYAVHFRILFQGYSLLSIEPNALEIELKERLKKIHGLYQPLTAAFDERVVSGQPFDFGYQSVPFGIAMISYSHAVNTLVDLWCSIWRASGGELEYHSFDKMN